MTWSPFKFCFENIQLSARYNKGTEKFFKGTVPGKAWGPQCLLCSEEVVETIDLPFV